MKKILAIIGSPRKGETLQAVKNFETALKKIEEVEVEYVMLSQVGLLDCTGCHNCVIKGRDYCRESQKIKELQDRMFSADAVILASPVYNQQITALMKKFLDYLTFLWHRPEMFHIKFFGISSGGGIFGEVFKTMKSNVLSWGGDWIGELGVPHYDSLTPKYKLKCDIDYNKKAELLLKAMDDKKPHIPSINQLMMFRVWKMNSVACKKAIPLDYAYWTEKGLFEKDFYYPVKIGLLKRILVGLISKMARSFMRKVYIGY